LTYCSEKFFNGVHYNCKQYPIANNLGLNKIVYYRFFKCNEELSSYKKITFIDNFEKTLWNIDKPLSEDEFKNILSILNKTFTSLKKKNQEHKTLASGTKICVNHLDINIDYSRAILIENDSLVIFQDFSLEQKAYLESIIKKGAL